MNARYRRRRAELDAAAKLHDAAEPPASTRTEPDRGTRFERFDPETGERVELDGSPRKTMRSPYDEGGKATGAYPLEENR